MATTVEAATMTCTITESVNLNGKSYGNTITKTTSIVGNVLQRIQAINTSEANLLVLGATDEAGQVVGDEMKYLRITNLDTTNFVHLSFKTAGEHFSIKLDAGDSYVLMSNQMNAEADTSIGSFEDMTNITALASGEVVDVEVLCVTT